MNGGRISGWALILGVGLCGEACSTHITPSDDGSGTDATDVAPASITVPFTSGTRLRARVIDGDNGAELFKTWIDTQFAAPCTFRPASDGRWRCLPESYDTLAYLDAACSHPAAVHSTYGTTCTAPPPGWVYAPAPDTTASCEVPRAGAIYQTAPTPSSVTTYYVLNNGVCQPVPVDTTTVALYAATLVAPETFVAATFSTEPHTAQLAATVLSADDGARMVYSAHDVRSDRDCAPVGTLGPVTDDGRCLPDVAWDVGNFFADATCSMPAAFYFDNCTPRVIISLRGLDPCGTVDLFSVGARAPAVSYSNMFGQSACSANSASDHYWYLGDPVSPGDFGTMDIVPVGTGRLRARYYAVGGAPWVRTWSRPFYDSATASTCEPTAVGDGMRCLPASVGNDLGNAFTDAACTHGLVAAYRSFSDCSMAPLVAAVRSTPVGCGTRGDLITLGARYMGNVFHLEGTQCVPTTDAGATEFYEPGAPADPNAYGAVVERTE